MIYMGPGATFTPHTDSAPDVGAYDMHDDIRESGYRESETAR